jgi:tRNA-modifying protein YgfZ
MQRAATDLSLPAVGALRARGADCVRFLQGQLSQNVELVSASRSALAGYHNAQGRVIAILRLVALAPDDLIAVLPRELVSAVATRLAKFVLRSKVTFADESDRWEIRGIVAAGGTPADWPRQRDAQRAVGDARVVCVDAHALRWLHVAPRSASASGAEPDAALEWRRAEVAAGEPQVFAATSEMFVSQMLNLDALGAIAFDKGCYTGQEIIARTHYRGRIKRRMQRFRIAAGASLAPGDRGRFADGRAFQVVQAAATAETTEFLAVTTLPGSASEPGAEESAGGGEVVHAEPLPLPYELPA